MNEEVRRHAALARFLKEALGDTHRVTLFDAADTSHAIAAGDRGLAPAEADDAALGALLGDILASDQLKQRDYLCCYTATDDAGGARRAAIYYLRDEGGRIVGFLSIEQTGRERYMVSEVFDQLLNPAEGDAPGADEQAAGGAEALASGATVSERIEEEMNALLRERISTTWDKCLAQTPKPRKAEKMAFMSELFEMGIFRMRGAAAQVSEVTGISQASIYRYLGEILED